MGGLPPTYSLYINWKTAEMILAAFAFLRLRSEPACIIFMFVQIRIISVYSYRRRKRTAFEKGAELVLSNSHLLSGMARLFDSARD
jgi:hypothetical protein